MQIVIDIDDNLYTRLFDNGVDNYDDTIDMAKAIRKGTPFPKEILINLNDYIKVKLNDRGKDIYYHQFDDIINKYPNCKIKPHIPRVDENGYTTFQIWDFINIYGEYIGMGCPDVLETLNVIYEYEE